jgi:thiol-disulfide isomerase/thioredoxin
MSNRISESVNELFSQGILTQTDEGVKPSEKFAQKRAEHRQMLNDSDVLESVYEEYASFAPDSCEPDSELLSNVLAVNSETSQLSNKMCFSIGLLLDRLDNKNHLSGVPEGFVPIAGPEIEKYLTEFPTSVLYFWREECPPCDKVRETFEQLLNSNDIPEFVGRAAIYGPDSAQFIQDRYDVAAAPTVLFTVKGQVDSRYVGPKPTCAFRSELETIVEIHNNTTSGV